MRGTNSTIIARQLCTQINLFLRKAATGRGASLIFPRGQSPKSKLPNSLPICGKRATHRTDRSVFSETARQYSYFTGLCMRFWVP